jgi:protein gp37
MATKIEWTECTWNPIIGCSKTSPACDNCYAERMACRLATMPATKGSYGTVVDLGVKRWNGKTALVESALAIPLRWRKPRRCFVGSMTDLFHESVPDGWLDRVFAVMALTPHITYQVLTKRPERMREYLMGSIRPIRIAQGTRDMLGGRRRGIEDLVLERCMWPLPNLWLGVTVENQAMADHRIPVLLDTLAAVRFVSVEPMLGAVDLRSGLDDCWWKCRTCGTECMAIMDDPVCDCEHPNYAEPGEPCADWVSLSSIDWVICGGETGPGARPMHPAWARGLLAQCREAGVPFFFKQWGDWGDIPYRLMAEKCVAVTPDGKKYSPSAAAFNGEGLPAGAAVRCLVGKKAAGRLLDGREWREFPGVRHGD